MRSRRISLLAMVGLALLAGCTDYVNKEDTVSFGAGDAMQANIAIHARKAFPRYRNAMVIRTDGKVAERVQRRFQDAVPANLPQATPQAAGAAAPPAAIPAAAPAQ